jgi:DNA-directed RNA polymerase II subunit RPB2
LKNLECLGTIIKKLSPTNGEHIYDFFNKTIEKNEMKYTDHMIKTIFKKLLYYKKPIYDILKQDLLPNIESFSDKILMICLILIEHINVIMFPKLISDRDNLIYKNFQITGELFKSLFSSLFKDFKKSCKKYIKKSIREKTDIDFNEFQKLSKITFYINKSIKSGDWKIKNQFGISQNLDCSNFISKITYTRRNVHNINPESKQSKIRETHQSEYGYKCPVETPEGKKCGIITHFSFLCYFSKEIDGSKIIGKIGDMKTFVESINNYINSNRNNYYKIIINGKLFGFVENGNNFTYEFRRHRRNRKIPFDVSISIIHSSYTIYIYSSSGRLLKPYYINKNHKSYNFKYDFELDDDEEDGVNIKQIEYIDIYEERNCIINPEVASNDKINELNSVGRSDDMYTHSEIDRGVFLGTIASSIPFSNNNAPTRNIFASNMMSQSYSIPSTNYNELYSKSTNVLYYPEIPLVSTIYSRISGIDDLPNGQNVIVAIMTYGGQNIEDAITMNRGAIERGLFTSIEYRTEVEMESKNEKLEKPKKKETKYIKDEWKRHKKSTLPIITDEGLPEIGYILKYNKIIFGKTLKIKKNEVDEYIKLDKSKLFNYKNGYYVESVLLTKNKYYDKIAKVRSLRRKIPEIGDKFTSRHGQKGVIGIIKNEEDMPYTRDGIIPDIIINPHAIPSRMTIGQILEQIFGKYAAITGCFQDGTPFNNVDIDKLKKEMHSIGYNKYGNEVMYNPENGKKIKSNIYLGVVYYIKLNHLSSDKVHVRNVGSNNILTRQPNDGGSANNGGHRFGEMEMNCVASHGCSQCIYEIMKRSDLYVIYVCAKCKLMANFDSSALSHLDIIKKKNCKACGIFGEIVKIRVPYAYKLLVQELMGQNISIRFYT